MSVCDHISQGSRSDPKPLISAVVIETSHIPTVWSLDRSRITTWGVSGEESDVIIFIETPRKSTIYDRILIPMKYEHKRTSDRKVRAICNL